MKVLALIAGALMTPEITRLRNAVDDELVHKYNSVNGIRDELVALTDEVSNIQSWVEKLEQIIWPHKEMLDWSRRAAEIQCEVDHYISEFLCEQNSCARIFIVRHRLVNHVKDLKRRLKGLADKYRSSNWDQLATSNMMYGLGCRASCILIQDHEDLFGFQGQLGDLVKLLQPEKNDSLKVISVVGSGGSGKTALALEAFSSVGSSYACRASICVSGCLDTTGLLMDICVQLGNLDPSTGELQSNHLIRKVADFLATKSYLILLDDLWRTEIWETLKPAFPKNKLGSRIVLTSRLNSVALICSRREELVLRMSPLNDDHSRRLFLDSIYGTSDCPPQFERNLGIILKRCGGVPLLILRMAGHILGRGPMLVDAWEEISSELNCFQDCYQSESLLSLHQNLFLSYTLLPRHLKECALSLAGLPGGSSLDLDVVISLWIAEDFVASRSEGEANVNELINQHLIKPVKTAGDGKIESVSVPRLMHDVLTKISDSKGFCTTAAPRYESGLGNTRLNRLSLDSQDVGFIAANNVLSHHTRAMILYSCRGLLRLGTCKFLRLLLIHQCSNFSNSDLKPIVELVYLRAVILNTPLVSELPHRIDKLQMLEVLLIQESKVTKMPNNIIRLELLTCLKVGIIAFSEGVAMLQNLEKLEIFDVGSSSEVAIKELGKLHNLKVLSCWWNLCTNNDRMHQDTIRATWFETALSELATEGRLEELTLSGGNEHMVTLSCFDFGTMSKLQKFHVDNPCFMIYVPPSIVSLLNLTHVSINLVSLKAEDVTTLGALPSLGLLKMWIKCSANVEFGEGMFPLLRRLFVSSDALKLEFKSGALLKLEKLHISITNEVDVLGLREVPALRALFVDAPANVAGVITTTINNAAAMCKGVAVIIRNEMKGDRADSLFGEEA